MLTDCSFSDDSFWYFPFCSLFFSITKPNGDNNFKMSYKSTIAQKSSKSWRVPRCRVDSFGTNHNAVFNYLAEILRSTEHPVLHGRTVLSPVCISLFCSINGIFRRFFCVSEQLNLLWIPNSSGSPFPDQCGLWISIHSIPDQSKIKHFLVSGFRIMFTWANETAEWKPDFSILKKKREK